MALTYYVLADYAQWYLSTSITTWATSFSLDSWEWASFPSTYPYILTIENITTDAYGNETINKREQVQVSNRSSDTFTVTRGQNWTTAQAFDAWDRVSIYLVKRVFTDMQDAIQALETDKLDNDALRTWLTASRILVTDWSGNEGYLAFSGSSTTYLDWTWSFSSPSTDINGQTTLSTADRTNDYLLVYDASAWVNKKIAIENVAQNATETVAWLVEKSTNTEAQTKTDTSRYVTPYHLWQYTFSRYEAVTASDNPASSWSTKDVSHTLWVTPKFIRITATVEWWVASAYSTWSYDWTNHRCVYMFATTTAWVITTWAIRVHDWTSDYMIWAITTLNTTKATITRTETWTFSVTNVHMLVEFFA